MRRQNSPPGGPPPNVNNRTNHLAGVRAARDVLGHLYNSPTVTLMLPYSYRMRHGEWNALRICFEHDPRARQDIAILQKLLLEMPPGGYAPANSVLQHPKAQKGICTPASVLSAAPPSAISTASTSRVSDAPASAVSFSSTTTGPAVLASAASTPTPSAPNLSTPLSPAISSTPKRTSTPPKPSDKAIDPPRYNTRGLRNRSTDTPRAKSSRKSPSSGFARPQSGLSETPTPTPFTRGSAENRQSSPRASHILPKPDATPNELTTTAGGPAQTQPEDTVVVAVGKEQRLFYLPASRLAPLSVSGQVSIEPQRAAFLPDEDPESFSLLTCWLQENHMPSVVMTQLPPITITVTLEEEVESPVEEASLAADLIDDDDDDGPSAQKKVKTTTAPSPNGRCDAGESMAESMQYSLLKLARMGERYEWESLRKAAMASYRDGELLLNRPQPLGMRLDLAQSLFHASSTSRKDILEIAMERIKKNRRLEGI